MAARTLGMRLMAAKAYPIYLKKVVFMALRDCGRLRVTLTMVPY